MSPDRLLNDDGTVIDLDQLPAPASTSRQDAIDACTLCDDDGYRGLVVCDHDPTHVAAAARGKAACLAEIARAKGSKS